MTVFSFLSVYGALTVATVAFGAAVPRGGRWVPMRVGQTVRNWSGRHDDDDQTVEDEGRQETKVSGPY